MKTALLLKGSTPLTSVTLSVTVVLNGVLSAEVAEERAVDVVTTALGNNLNTAGTYDVESYLIQSDGDLARSAL